jgi:hypothetical protein
LEWPQPPTSYIFGGKAHEASGQSAQFPWLTFLVILKLTELLQGFRGIAHVILEMATAKGLCGGQPEMSWWSSFGSLNVK